MYVYTSALSGATGMLGSRFNSFFCYLINICIKNRRKKVCEREPDFMPLSQSRHRVGKLTGRLPGDLRVDM